MKKFIERRDELDICITKFLLEDNSFLDPEYVSALKQEYTGVYYDRFIQGLWVVAEGAVYKVFSENISSYHTDKPQYDYCSIGVDIGGNKSAHTFVASGLKNDGSMLTALMSRRHTATGTTTEDFYRLFDSFLADFIKLYGIPRYIFVDSAEQMITNGLRERYGPRSKYNISVRGSDKERIMERVRVTTMLMTQGRFKMTADCESLKEAFRGAVYKEKSTSDERLDDGTSDIDTLDAFEYSWEKDIRKYSRIRQERDGR